MRSFELKKYFGESRWNANNHETTCIKTDAVERCFRCKIRKKK